jgi:hypothetical protein
MKIKIAALLVLVAAVPALAQKNWMVERTIHIGGTGGWDYVTVDPQAARYTVRLGNVLGIH